jgi:hypothetical protein
LYQTKSNSLTQKIRAADFSRAADQPEGQAAQAEPGEVRLASARVRFAERGYPYRRSGSRLPSPWTDSGPLILREVASSWSHDRTFACYDTEKIFMWGGKPVRVPFREHIPPDPYAAFKWLQCRRMHEWRDRKEITGADGGPLAPIVALLSEIDGGTVSLVE